MPGIREAYLNATQSSRICGMLKVMVEVVQ